jgi:hypothetical protein
MVACNGLSNASMANPIATTQIPMQYVVTGTTANGCVGKDTVNIEFTRSQQSQSVMILQFAKTVLYSYL